MRTVATRPSERVFKDDCTPTQWAIIKRHQLSLQHAVARQRAGTEIEHACVGSRGASRGATLTRQGQQSLHAYGQTSHVATFPTCGRRRPVQPQSEELRSFHNRPPQVGNINFDVSTMTPTPLCVPQGTWSATARHGQAVIRQHPQPWRGSRLKPSAQDVTLDSAQLAVLLARGASLAEVVEACERQPMARGSWAKVLTTGIGAAAQATTWWGCTALTWDTHFPRFVSANAEDGSLGALTPVQAMSTVDTDTVIDLNAFSEDIQKRIVQQLGKGLCSR